MIAKVKDARNKTRVKTTSAALAIGRVTFTELMRDRVLYNILIFGFLLFGLGYLASRLSFLRPDRIVLDFGVSAVSLSCTLLGGIMGANLILREYERRTVSLVLSRPITHLQFILGKYCGLAAVLFVDWLLMSGVLLVLLLASYNGADSITPTLFIALFLALMQSLVVTSIAVLISTFSTVTLSAMITAGIFLVGNNIPSIISILERVSSPVTRKILELMTLLIPNFNHFALGTEVTYGLPVPIRLVILAVAYGFTVSSLGILISVWFIKVRPE